MMRFVLTTWPGGPFSMMTAQARTEYARYRLSAIGPAVCCKNVSIMRKIWPAESIPESSEINAGAPRRSAGERTIPKRVRATSKKVRTKSRSASVPALVTTGAERLNPLLKHGYCHQKSPNLPSKPKESALQRVNFSQILRFDFDSPLDMDE